MDLSQPDQLCIYSSPDPTLTLIYYQLTVVEWRRGRCRVSQILTLIQGFYLESFFLFYMVKSVLTSKIAKFHFRAICKVTSLIDMDGCSLSLTCDGKAGSEGISISLPELSFHAHQNHTKSRYFVFGFYFVDKYEGNVHLKVFVYCGYLFLRKCCK